MDAVQATSSSASNVAWAPTLATIFLGICLAIAVGFVAVYWKSQDKFLRSLAGFALVAVALVVIAILLVALEIISNSVFVPALVALLATLGTVFWVLALVDAASNEPSQGNDKIVWVLIIIFTNIIGAFLYFAVRRPRRLADTEV